MMALGQNIRFHRERLSLTLEQLSERSGVDVGTISALEIRNSSRSKFAPEISKALGFTVEQLSDDAFDWRLAQDTSSWPFDLLDESKVRKLSREDRIRLETTVLAFAEKYGFDVAKEARQTAA